MTQREFWKEIEARTSKEVADFGFDSIVEPHLPGVRHYADDDLRCADLDAAAQAAQQAYDDAFKGSEEDRCGECGSDNGPICQWRGLTLCDECINSSLDPERP